MVIYKSKFTGKIKTKIYSSKGFNLKCNNPSLLLNALNAPWMSHNFKFTFFKGSRGRSKLRVKT